MRLAILDINFGIELELEMIGVFLGFAGAGESEALGLEVDLNFGRINVGCSNGEIDVVLFWIRRGGALSPGDYVENKD